MADNGIRPHTVHIETEAVTLDGTVRLTEEDHARGRELLDAAKSGNVERVHDLLNEGVDVSYRDPLERNWNALLWASANGHAEVVGILLKFGAATEFKPTEPEIPRPITAPVIGKSPKASTIVNSPLHWASYKGHTRVVWKLIQAGIPPSDIDNCGNSSLHLACTGGHLSVVKCLLSQGVDLSQKNFYGNTVVTLATIEPLRSFIRAKASQTSCTASGTPFSSSSLRFMCDCCEQMFLGTYVRKYLVLVSSSTDVKPVRYCDTCKERVSATEGLLREAMETKSIESLESTIKNAKELGCDVIQISQAEEILRCVQAEKALREQMEIIRQNRPIRRRTDLTPLANAVAKARENGVPVQLVEDAQALRRCAVSETTILDLIDQLQSVPHISDVHEWLLTRLDTALNTAKMENADDEIINRAESLNFTMHAELELVRSMDVARVSMQEKGEVKHVEDEKSEEVKPEVLASPEEILEALRVKVERLDAAVISATEGKVKEELLQSAQELSRQFNKYFKAAVVEEEERKQREEAERLKAERKKKKGKGKKKK